MIRSKRWLGAVLFALASGGCLSADDEDPGALFVTAEPSEALHGFDTIDGWRIDLHTVAVAIGRVWVREDEGCSSFSGTNYSWLIDFAAAGQEKVALAHGLGSCSLQFAITPPDRSFTRLGAGADPTLFAALEWKGAIRVQGRAVRGDDVLFIDWTVGGWVDFGPCLSPSGEGRAQRFDLGVAGWHHERLVIRPEGLFEEPGVVGVTHFGHYANADFDFDGVISSEEFEAVQDFASPVWFEEGILTTAGHLIMTAEGGFCLHPHYF